MTTEQQRTIVLGVDLGGGAIKIYGPLGGVELPAHAASANRRRRQSKVTGLRSMKPPMRVILDGNGFYVGLGAHDWGRPVENLGDERFAGSPEVRALFYGALAQYVKEHGSICCQDDQVQVIGGLTQSTFREGRGGEMVSAVKGWLSGDHAWTVENGKDGSDTDQFMLTVDSVSVTSQAAGAIFDYFLDCGGYYIAQRKRDFKKEIGVVSIGMNTLELLVLRNGAPVERFMDSQTAGVRRLLEITDPSGMYSRGELDTRLRTGKLDIKEALPVWASEINGHIERRWGAAYQRFTKILVVGGGAILLEESLHLDGKATFVQDPVLAVARGLYKMGLMRLNRRRR